MTIDLTAMSNPLKEGEEAYQKFIQCVFNHWTDLAQGQEVGDSQEALAAQEEQLSAVGESAEVTANAISFTPPRVNLEIFQRMLTHGRSVSALMRDITHAIQGTPIFMAACLDSANAELLQDQAQAVSILEMLSRCDSLPNLKGKMNRLFSETENLVEKLKVINSKYAQLKHVEDVTPDSGAKNFSSFVHDFGVQVDKVSPADDAKEDVDMRCQVLVVSLGKLLDFSHDMHNSVLAAC